MNIANQASLTIALAIAVAVATAQVTIKTEGTATSVVAGAPAQVVTVDGYRTRLRESYVSVGLPDTIIEQVLPVDVEIYNARLVGDAEKIRVLRQRQIEIVTPAYLPKVRTYFTSHPYVVNIGGGPFTVWYEDAVASDGEIISVMVYEQRLRASYVSIGLPETIIVQLLPIDILIYNAYVSNNVTLVSQLQDRQYQLVPAEYSTKMTTYFREQPIRVKTTANTTFVAWQKASESGSVQTDKSKTIPAQTEAVKAATDISRPPTQAAQPAQPAQPSQAMKGGAPASPAPGGEKPIEKKHQDPMPGTVKIQEKKQPGAMMEKAPHTGTRTMPERKPEAGKPEKPVEKQEP